MLVTKQLTLAFDFNSAFCFHIVEVNGCCELFGYQDYLNYTQVQNNLRMTK